MSDIITEIEGINPTGPLSYLGVLRTLINNYITSERNLLKNDNLHETSKKDIEEKLLSIITFTEGYAQSESLTTQLNIAGVYSLWVDLRENKYVTSFIFFLTAKFKLLYSDRWDEVIDNVAETYYFPLKIPNLDPLATEDDVVDELQKSLFRKEDIVKMLHDNHWLVILCLIALLEPVVV